MSSESSPNGRLLRPSLTTPVSPRNFPVERLEQLWRLRGGHLRDFMDVLVREDIRSKRHVQSYAVGTMPTAEHEITGEGEPTMNKVVGWMRARFERAFKGDRPLADIEEIHVDPTVDRISVTDFLLRRLQDKVRSRVDKLSGLRVSVPPELERYTQYYMEHGFREAPHDDGDLIWVPA